MEPARHCRHAQAEQRDGEEGEERRVEQRLGVWQTWGNGVEVHVGRVVSISCFFMRRIAMVRRGRGDGLW